MNGFLQVVARQSWLRFGLRDRLVRRFDDPDAPVSRPFEVDYFGYRYSGDRRSFLDWSVYYYGAYSGQELVLLHDLLRRTPGGVLLDVGCNVGLHGLYAARFAGHVVAFEPFHAVADLFQRTLERNPTPNVTLCRYGLGDANAFVSFEPPGGGNLGTGKFEPGAEGREGAATGLKLEVRRGDDAIASLGLDRVDVIKMDVEGMEDRALQGLGETLRRFRPVIFFEWSQRQRTGSGAGRADLFPPGYAFFAFQVDRPLLGIFNRAAYVLAPLGADWPDGNLVAAPAEVAQALYWP